MDKTCPECRRLVVMEQTRRIYFNISTHSDNLQSYVDYLDTVNTTISNKLNMAGIQMQEIQMNCSNKLREKDSEIQRLHEKNNRLKSKLKDVCIAHVIFSFR